ncbi:MAG: ROK family glucokinase [Lachnospiraceae bacterium]
MKKYVIGADIGGTLIKMGLFSVDGNLLDFWEIETRKNKSGAYILRDTADSVKKKIAEKGISYDEIEGMGIGVPGPVDSEGNVDGCTNLGWGRKNVCNEAEQLTGFKVKAGNDANLAALGETWMGGGRSFDDLVMMTFGTGVGGGIVLNGKILNGCRGSAGEIGHLKMSDTENLKCGCGNTGCLEQYVSASRFAEITAVYLKEHPEEKSLMRNFEDLTCKDIFDCARDGDILAEKMVDNACRMIGKACAMIACVVDPQVFVFGGGMSKAGQILLDGIEKYFREYAFHTQKNTRLALAQLGNKAGIYGAAKLVIRDE